VTRTLEDQQLVMVANCSSARVTVPDGTLPDLSGAEVLLATHPGAGSAELAPWESRLYLRR
jgi:oligo-1,6-glucosidase